jgi:hypothetical protein
MTQTKKQKKKIDKVMGEFKRPTGQGYRSSRKPKGMA